MADPVLRIPVDDEDFKRYLEAFQRYRVQLQEQPEMWRDTNERVLEGVAANLALADAIGTAVAAAIRLGDTEERNSERRKRDKQDEDSEQQRASSWRRKALDHVQELSRTSDKVARSFTGIASGGANNGGLFGMLADGGKNLGGDIGAIVSLVGHTLNAGYEANNAVSDKGLFARGIGATLGQQEGFHNNLGRYTNTDQGIDAVMNARGTPSEWWQFNSLGVQGYRGDKSNAQVYGDVLRAQTALAKRYTHNGVTDWFAADPRGATAFGTTHEDLNRLKGLSGPELEKAIKEAVSFKTPLGDKQIDAATKSVIAMDNLTTRLTDNTQLLALQLDPALDKLTAGVNRLADLMGKVYDLFTFHWFGSSAAAPAGAGTQPGVNNGVTPQLGGGGPGRAPSGPLPPAGGPGRAPVGAMSFTPAQGPGTLADVEAMAKRMGWQESSGMRSHAKQEQLYAAYQNYLHGGAWAPVAAKPGTSHHEDGTAIDIRYGKGVTLDKIKAELRKMGIRPTEAFNEGNHFHLAWGGKGAGGGSGGAGSQNTTVHVKVTAPAGHQTAVVTNSTARS